MTLYCCIPSGEQAVVEARQEVRRLCLVPGFLPSTFAPPSHIIRGLPVLPIPIDTRYVGSGMPTLRLHPSPWCNPFSSTSLSEADARRQFWVYAVGRADLLQWLLPLAGKILLAEDNASGAHVEDLRDLLVVITTVFSRKQKKAQVHSNPNKHPHKLHQHKHMTERLTDPNL